MITSIRVIIEMVTQHGHYNISEILVQHGLVRVLYVHFYSKCDSLTTRMLHFRYDRTTQPVIIHY